MLPGWATTSISFSEREKGAWVLVHGLVLGDTASHIAEVCLGSVGFSRCHMTDDLTAIERDPVECGVWEVVDVVPAEFLGEESRHASESTNLRELG